MAYVVSVINSGSEVYLESLAKLKAHDGWGAVPSHLITTRGPLQHGVSVLDYRMDPRVGVLVFQPKTNKSADMYSLRQQFLNLFAPGNNSKLRFYLSTGTWEISCRYLDSLTLPWSADDGWAPKLGLQLFCPDGYFYDPAGEAVAFALGAGSGSFVVPVVVPISVGASDINQSQPVQYRGNIDSVIDKIRIDGPVTNPILRNLTTGEKLDFTGHTIDVNHYYEIDPRYGYQTVMYDGITDITNYLTNDSDLATFHLKAATDGSSLLTNTFQFTGSAANGNTKVNLTYYRKRSGI